MLKHVLFYSIIFLMLACKPASLSSQTGEKVVPGFSADNWGREGELYTQPAHFFDRELTNKINVFVSDAVSENAVLVLQPDASKKNWTDLGLGKKGIRVFLLKPGDYRRYGEIQISDRSGTATQPYIVAALAQGTTNKASAVHPVQFSEDASREVLLESFTLKNSDYWIFYGLTFRGNNSKDEGLVGGLTCMLRDGADNNIMNRCVVEKVLKGSFIRILDGSYNRIQECVIRDKVEGLKGDNVGIQISAYEGAVSKRNIITGNEIYNVTDCIAISRQDGNAQKEVKRPQTGEAPGTVIENNDMYITTQLYRKSTNAKTVSACSENALDLKTGTYSEKHEDKLLITGNRMWGFRNSEKDCGATGSAGQAVVFHRNASNIIFCDNVVADAPGAIAIMGTNPLYPNEKVKNIWILNNIFYNIRSKSVSDVYKGEVFHFARSANIYFNTIVSSDIALNAVKADEQINFGGNVLNEVGKLVQTDHGKSGYSSAGNLLKNSKIETQQLLGNYSDESTDMNTFKIRTRLLTGSEIMTIPGVIPARKLQECTLSAPMNATYFRGAVEKALKGNK